MNGDWNFYWMQLLSPQDIEQGKGRSQGYLSPEVNPSGVQLQGTQLNAVGYMTYAVDFLIDHPQPLTLRIPELPSALKIWLNGEEIASFGTLSTDPNQPEHTARMQVFLHNFQPRAGKNNLTIALSNHSFAYHGAAGGVQIGLNRTLARDYVADMFMDSVVLGALLIMAFYHLYLWWIRKNRRSPLYFGVFCFAIGLRSLTAGRGEILSYFFPEAPVELQIKIEYLGIFIGLISMNFFVHELYPKEYRTLFRNSMAGASLLGACLALLTSAIFFPRFLAAYQALIAISGILQMIAIVRAVYRRREGADLFFAGFCIFFVAGINDILLAKKLISSIPAAHIGTLGFVFFQSLLLSKRFDQAFDNSEKAEKKIRALNEDLEHLVKQRTDQINTILANVSSGFLLIDRSGRLMPGFTASCHQLLGIEMHAGQILTNYLPVDNDSKKRINLAVRQVFEDQMPIDVSLSQIPDRILIGQHSLSIAAAPLRDQVSGRIKAILFTINDVSNLQEAERQVQHNEMLLIILQEKESFNLFLKEYQEEWKDALRSVESGQQASVRTFLHTLKGNLSSFGIQDMALKVHEIEGKERIDAADLSRIAETMDEFLAKNAQLLGLDATQDTLYELSQDDFKRLLARMNLLADATERNQLIDLFRNSCQKSVSSYIGPLQNSAMKLAHRLGKELSCEIAGKDLRVDERFAPILRNLVHLVRNSIDHGIELPEDRLNKGPAGRIELKFSLTPEAFLIVVEDDGRGLDLAEIETRGRELGLIKASEPRLTDDAIAELVFKPGFSTRKVVTDISGRGVGLDAVGEAVHRLQGTIQIKTRSGFGTRIEIRLPSESHSTKAA